MTAGTAAREFCVSEVPCTPCSRCCNGEVRTRRYVSHTKRGLLSAPDWHRARRSRLGTPPPALPPEARRRAIFEDVDPCSAVPPSPTVYVVNAWHYFDRKMRQKMPHMRPRGRGAKPLLSVASPRPGTVSRSLSSPLLSCDQRTLIRSFVHLCRARQGPKRCPHQLGLPGHPARTVPTCTDTYFAGLQNIKRPRFALSPLSIGRLVARQPFMSLHHIGPRSQCC